MKPTEAKKLQSGDVVATSDNPKWAARCVVDRIEVLSPSRVVVHLLGGAARREGEIYHVTEQIQARWDQLDAERRKYDERQAEKARVAAFFGSPVVPAYSGSGYGAKETSYTVTLSREQALAFMEKYGEVKP